MEIDGHKLDLGLASWKRFMILGGVLYLVWQAMLIPSIDGDIKGFLLAAALMATQFYFQTHKDQPAATCDTEDDPDNPVPTKSHLFPGKTKEEIEQELAFGKGAPDKITSTPGWSNNERSDMK